MGAGIGRTGRASEAMGERVGAVSVMDILVMEKEGFYSIGGTENFTDLP